MPKLDPSDTDQPTSADIVAAQSDNTPSPGPTPAPVTPPPTLSKAPSNLFGSTASAQTTFISPQPTVVMTNFQQPQQQMVDTSAFSAAMAAESSAPPEHWMKSFWRPAMGWLYMLICFADFIVFPALSMFLPVIERGFGLAIGYTPWQSLTLSNGGLIHLAFGAILGVSAYGRTKEKTTGSS
jgi:Holin of 3TMs, for gene-transfer release